MYVPKIERFNLDQYALQLRGHGFSTKAIAEKLNEKMQGKEKISQSAVRRWLKSVEERRRKVVQPKVEEFLLETVESDLKCLQEMMEFQYIQFKGKLVDGASSESDPLYLPLKDRNKAHDRLLDILKVKFKWMGVGDDGGGRRADPVDLSKFKKEKKKGEGGT